jgi:hypothetical protein
MAACREHLDAVARSRPRLLLMGQTWNCLRRPLIRRRPTYVACTDAVLRLTPARLRKAVTEDIGVAYAIPEPPN